MFTESFSTMYVSLALTTPGSCADCPMSTGQQHGPTGPISFSGQVEEVAPGRTFFVSTLPNCALWSYFGMYTGCLFTEVEGGKYRFSRLDTRPCFGCPPIF